MRGIHIVLSFYLVAIETQEDRDLFTSLYVEYKGFMFHVANRVLNDHHAAENIVHDAFIRMIENIDKFNPRNSRKTKGFIGIIVDGLAKDEYRRRKRISSLDDESEDILASSDNLDAQIVHREQYENLRKHVERLDYIYKNPLLLKYEYQFCTKQIAEITGVTADTVRQRIRRAKLKLRELLVEEEQKVY